MVEWLKEAVFYEIYPQSFKDTNGDGIGDFNGITEKLDYIKDLGCNALWINPCFDSPFKDAGYDVRDYMKVAERYGTMEDICRLFKVAHEKGIHVLLDLVPGHTSEEHPWFVASQKHGHNEYSERFIWTKHWFQRPEKLAGIAGEGERNGVYITNFFKCQPALNYGFLNPEESWQKGIDDPDCKATRDAMRDVICFWLEKGCDGFRVDMAASLVKNDDEEKSGTCRVWRDIFGQVNEKYPEAVFVSEWSEPRQAIGKAGFQMDFFLNAPGNGYNLLLRDYDESGRNDSFFKRDSKRSILDFMDRYLPDYESIKDKGFYCLITGNHDTDRIAYHLDERELKLAYAFLFTMPGVPFLYYGDEIGMHFLADLPSKEGGYTRTGSRTPMQWDDSENCGFSDAEGDKLYLPVDKCSDAPSVESQKKRPDSLYNMVKELLATRKQEEAFKHHDNLELVSAVKDKRSFAYRRGDLLFLCNPSGEAQELEVKTGAARKIFEVGSYEGREDGVLLQPQSFVILKG